MLAKQSVLERIGAGDISISYGGDPTSSVVEVLDQKLVLDSNIDTARRVFDATFFGDRLPITVGFLVYRHRNGWLKKSQRYRDDRRIADLRKSDNKYQLKPGESITVNTLESVGLSQRIGAISLPRLSDTMGGLQVSPSYIDPGWSGLLTLALTNTSTEIIPISVGQRISVVRFYDLDPPAGDEVSSFSEKSPRHGQTWRNILVDGRPPFPQRIHGDEDNRGLALLIGTGDFLKRHIVPAAGLTLVTLILAIWNFVPQVRDRWDALAKVRTLEAEVNEIGRDQAALAKALPVVGTARIEIPAGGTAASLSVRIPGQGSPTASTVFLEQPPASAATVNGELLSAANGLTLRLRATSDVAQSEPVIINVSYLVYLVS